MTTSISRPLHAHRDETLSSFVAKHLAWFAAIAGVAFLVPYALTSATSVHHDLYYAIYFAASLGVVALYVAANRVPIAHLLRQNWQLSIVLGLVASVFLVWNVLTREDSTPRPDGAYFAFEFLWRGIAYGAVDAILLTVVPAMVAFNLLRHDVTGVARRVAFGSIAFMLTIVITATYHMGYEQYREDGLGQPETGNAIISLPAIVSVSPLGSIVAHSAMHGAAVVHSYETDVFLPPQTDADSAASTDSLTVGEAVEMIRNTTTETRPILLPNAIPSEWLAQVRADDAGFAVTFRSLSGEQSITLEAGTISEPVAGSASGQSRPGFHGDRESLYLVEDKNDPRGERHVTWTERGVWGVRPELDGVPYHLSANGLSDAEFWKIANSLHPNQI